MNIPSTFNEILVRQHQQDSNQRFTLELGLFIVFLFGSFTVSVNNLNYNTLFLDEAIYAGVGRDFLQGDYSRNAISYLFGSYLYPTLAATLNDLGGVSAMRFASAILMGLASIFIYFTTRKLFGRKAGLFGMLLFSFSGNILNLSQLAVYDALALPLLAASLFLLVIATTSQEHQKYLILASAACTVLAILSKYIGLIYIPALFLTALVLFGLTGTALLKASYTLFKYFILPILQVLSIYTAFYWNELLLVFQGQGFSLAPRGLILKTIAQEIGVIVLLALAGLIVMMFVLPRQSLNSQLPLWRARSQFNLSTPRTRVIFFTLFVLLLSTWLASPLQHWLTANIRSLWKNSAYSLIFLCPLAGYCIAAMVESLRSRNLFVNLTGMLLLCAGAFYFSDKALDSNWSFHQSWPNNARVVTYLQEAGLDENSRVLAEGMDIYEYYFASQINNRAVWNNFWYMEYEGLNGQEGALAAISDQDPDFIIIDDYYFPGIRERVAPLLTEAGYVVGWEENQELHTGETILLQVYVRREGSSQ